MKIMRNGATPTPAASETNWHALPEADLLARLGSGPEGLGRERAKELLEEYGPNILPGKVPPSLLTVVLHQFKSPLIYILIIAAVISLAIGDFKDAIFIFLVILLNAAIGTIQEWRAEQSAHALQNLLKIRTRVRRGGEVETLPAEDLVPGDAVLLESGEKAPADLRLLQATGLALDESFLTGESLPVQKRPGAAPAETPVSDRTNMTFAGATVLTGRGLGLVTSTGIRTEVGKIARSITETESAKPPLIIRMDRFAQQVGMVVLLCSALLGVLLVSRGHPLLDVFFVMIAMAVASIPEGLPVAMTVALSLATSRMAARGVIARRLVAVESLGSCTTIASDKTGTLTVNQQTVKRILLADGTRVAVGGQGYNDDGTVGPEAGGALDGPPAERLVAFGRAAVLCNEGSLVRKEGAWVHSGDSMDVALLALGRKLGLDPEAERRRFPLVGEIPFESERRYAATAYRTGEEARVVVKGAVEAVAPFCGSAGDASADRDALLRRADELAAAGYRVLLIAEGVLEGWEPDQPLAESHLKGLAVLGLAGFMDPLRPEVKAAVDRAHGAGVKVVMITGDHPATALAIARQLDIASEETQLITGGALADPAARGNGGLEERLRDIRVFARVTPEQKLAIVDHLMALGEFVAVTGDGVNDAPALNRANIGVAMGSGTEVAKDAAQIIVTDDNFSSIVNGIEEGRFAYANVRKVTLFLITTGFAQILLIAAAVMMDLPLPFIAVQLLWLNLVTNGIQDVALAFEKGEAGIMRMPPRRPTENIFNRKMIEQVLLGGVTMAVVCLLAWRHWTAAGVGEDQARNLILTLMILLQFFHVLNCRSEVRSLFRVPLRNNRVLFIGMAAAFAIHLAAMHWPVTQALLRIAPLPAREWLILAAAAVVQVPVMELYKLLKRDPEEKLR